MVTVKMMTGMRETKTCQVVQTVTPTTTATQLSMLPVPARRRKPQLGTSPMPRSKRALCSIFKQGQNKAHLACLLPSHILLLVLLQCETCPHHAHTYARTHTHTHTCCCPPLLAVSLGFTPSREKAPITWCSVYRDVLPSRGELARMLSPQKLAFQIPLRQCTYICLYYVW